MTSANLAQPVTTGKKPFSKDILLLDDVEAVVETITTRLREDVFRTLSRKGGVVGISGGIDSSVCLALTARALGPDKVLGVMIPERDSNPESEVFATMLAGKFGVTAI